MYCKETEVHIRVSFKDTSKEEMIKALLRKREFWDEDLKRDLNTMSDDEIIMEYGVVLYHCKDEVLPHLVKGNFTMSEPYGLYI